MSDTYTISEAVRRGYDALLAAGHTPEAIHAAVFAGDFDMATCDRCVIGHLYELPDDDYLGDNFYDAVKFVTGHRYSASDFGFNLDRVTYDAYDAYERLGDEWRRLVAEKAAPTIAPSALRTNGTDGDAHPGPAGGVSENATQAGGSTEDGDTSPRRPGASPRAGTAGRNCGDSSPEVDPRPSTARSTP